SLFALALAWDRVEAGDGDGVRRWCAVAQRGAYPGRLPGGPASLEAGVALLRGLLGRGGVSRVVDDARRAFDADDDDSPWRGAARLVEGAGRRLLGDPESARACLLDAERRTVGALPSLHAITLAETALLDIE